MGDRAPRNVTDIEHADSFALEQGFLPLVQAIRPDQSWEAGAVSGASLIAGDPVVPNGIWIIFYTGGGAIGWATAPAITLGHNWTKAPGPALLADGAEEGTELTLAGGGADRRSRARLLPRARRDLGGGGAVGRRRRRTRDDAGRGSTAIPARPSAIRCCSAPPWALSIGRFTARADKTPAGRVRHDLYFTAVTAPTAAQPSISTCGFASSFTGDRFEIAAAPILPLKSATHAPAETPYRDGALLLYIERSGARDAVAAARSP